MTFFLSNEHKKRLGINLSESRCVVFSTKFILNKQHIFSLQPMGMNEEFYPSYTQRIKKKQNWKKNRLQLVLIVEQKGI